MATEKQLEAKVVAWAKEIGGVAIKGATQFETGYPDRVIYLQGNMVHAEIKGTSNRYHLNDKQKLWAGRIMAANQPYYIIESDEGLERMKQEYSINARAYTKNTYVLNGLDITLDINDITGAVNVCVHKDQTIRRVYSGLMPKEPHYKTIYRIFKKLEELYPNTNYEDI